MESLEQFCLKVKDTKDNPDSAKKCSSEYYEPNEDAGLNSSPETDSSNDEEEEGIVDLEAELVEALDEISILHKLIGKQAKNIALLQSQLEEDKTKEEKNIQDDKNEDLEANFKAALNEIGSLYEFIKQQTSKLSLLQTQLEGRKIKEVELLQLLQDKEEEVIKAREEIAEIQKENALLQDALQKSKRKHDETSLTILEATKTKEECKQTIFSCQDLIKENAAASWKYGTYSLSL